MNFFTSDLHFGSDKTIIRDNRPFKNAKVFEKSVVKQWNKVADKNDTIYVIGDLVDCHLDTKDSCIKKLDVVKKIKAKVVLIMGNNEQKIIKNHFDNSFECFKNYCLDLGYFDVKQNDIVTVNNTQFFLTHKPKEHKDDMLNLFGHSHKAMGLYKTFGFNIGCDLNNYELYSETDIKDLLDKKDEYWDKDENLKLV